MKKLLLALTVAFMACNGKEVKEPESNSEIATDIMQSDYDSMMKRTDTGMRTIWVNPKFTRIEGNVIDTCTQNTWWGDGIQCSMNWDSINITNDKVTINECINDWELNIIMDSVNRRGIHPQIIIYGRRELHNKHTYYFKPK